MSDFNNQEDYYEEEVQRQTRARGRRGLPLWPLVVIVLLILVVFISLWNPFAPSPAPTVGTTPTVTRTLPTLPSLPTATPTPRPTPIPTIPTEITVGGYVKVIGAEADQLSYRSGPGLNYARLDFVKDGTILKVLEGPQEADGYTWWRLQDEEGFIGWAADKWLKPTLP